MTLRIYSLASVVTLQNGDEFEQVGKYRIRIIRNGNTLTELDLRTIPNEPLTGPIKLGGNNLATIIWEDSLMPGQNVALTGVTENQTSGAVTFKYSNGNNVEYPSWAAVEEVADSIDADPIVCEKILAAVSYRSSPDGSNKATQVGASISINALADVPVVYTEPQ